MKYLTCILSTAFFISTIAEAKRAASDVKPITRHGTVYSYAVEPMTKGCVYPAKECGGRVFLVAKTAGKDPHQLWKTELYNYKFNMKMEKDSQAVVPKALKLKGADRVELTDERDRRYIVKESTGKLFWPAVPRPYHAPRSN